MIDVTLLGCGGMMPLHDRYLTSLYIRSGEGGILIDCGEGTQSTIRKQGLKFAPIDAILITHFHADHISGLVGLLLSMSNEGRTRPLLMAGPVGLERVVRSLCVIAWGLSFEIEFLELEFPKAHSFKCAGLTVNAFPLDHKMDCFGYSLELERQRGFDVEAAMRKGIPKRLWGCLQRGESVENFTPEDVLGAPRRGIKLLYATDTRPVDSIEEFGKGCDLMILEGMYGDLEKYERACLTGHMMMDEASRLASRLEPKELWLTHYSPSNTQPYAYVDTLKQIFENTVVASDGQHTVLTFDK